jgi:PAS domain S-box-containing protein
MRRSTVSLRFLPYTVAVLGIGAVTGVFASLAGRVNTTTIAMAMLLVVMFTASAGGRWPGLMASLLAALSFDYFFLPPIGSFTIASPQDWMTFATLVAVAITVGELSERARRRTSRAESEQIRAEHESAYVRGLIEANLDPLVTIGRDGTITDLNAATAAITGRARSELIGADFANCFTDPEQAGAGYRRAFAQGFVRNYPLELRSGDGASVPVLCNAAVYRNEAGEVAGVIAAVREVSGQVQAEREIRRLASFPQRTPVAVVELDRALRIQFVNPAMQSLLADCGIEDPVRLVPDDWKEKLAQSDLVDEAGSAEVELAGRSFDEHLSLSQEFQSLRLWVTDVTELRRAQKRDHLAALYARSLIEASPDPLMAIDAEGRITDVNRAAEDATGLARSGLIGTDVGSHCTEPEKARAIYRQVLATGAVTDVPLAVRHVSGEVVDMLCSASAYRDEEGRVAGVFVVARNAARRAPARAAEAPVPLPRQQRAQAGEADAQAMSGLDVGLIRLYRSYARLAGVGAALLGGGALLGWIGGVPLLASFGPAWVTMKVNTAVALVAAGIGLLLATPDGAARRGRASVAAIGAGLVMALGFATLAEYVFGQSFGIDQLLIVEPAGTTATMVPGRMAPTTAVSLGLFGLALLIHVIEPGRVISTLPAVPVLAYAVLVITGYLFGAEELYSIRGRYTAMGVSTGLAFLLLASGLLVTGSERGILRWLASPRSGGVMLRRLLPVTVCIPLLISWVRLQAQAAGLFATGEFGAASVGVANVVFLSCVLLLVAAELDRSDSARLRSEQHRAAAQYARSLIEASLDPLVAISPDGKITDVNRATEEAVGRSRSGLIGTDFADYFTEPEKARTSYQRALQTGSVVDYPLALRHVNGSVVDVLYNASIYRDGAGDVAGVFAAARDVTARKQAEDQLRASELQYRTLVAAINDGLMLVDAELIITYVNDKFAEMLGYAEADIVGHRSPEFMDEASRLMIPDALERRKAGIAERYEVTFVRRDGQPLPTQLSARPIFDEEHNYRASLSVVRDLTEIKHAETELANYRQHLEELVDSRTADLSKANALLEAANKELESFSYSVSHDLRVPLRAIDGFSRILIEDYADKLDEEGRRVANTVRDSAQRMGRLIDDILAFSRVGRVEMTDEPIDMDALARSVVAELEPLAAGRKLTIEIKPLPPVRGDPAMMRRVWSNLFDNAIKFTKPKEAAAIEAGARTEGDEVVYYVKDNGVGFDMAYVDKLFGVFQRLHGVDEFPGTGIGLAIIKRIVARQGGRVWAEGKVNEGATFHFAFPIGETKNVQ